MSSPAGLLFCVSGWGDAMPSEFPRELVALVHDYYCDVFNSDLFLRLLVDRGREWWRIRQSDEVVACGCSMARSLDCVIEYGFSTRPLAKLQKGERRPGMDMEPVVSIERRQQTEITVRLPESAQLTANLLVQIIGALCSQWTYVRHGNGTFAWERTHNLMDAKLTHLSLCDKPCATRLPKHDGPNPNTPVARNDAALETLRHPPHLHVHVDAVLSKCFSPQST